MRLPWQRHREPYGSAGGCPRCAWILSQPDESMMFLWSLGQSLRTDAAEQGRRVKTMAIIGHAKEGHWDSERDRADFIRMLTVAPTVALTPPAHRS